MKSKLNTLLLLLILAAVLVCTAVLIGNAVNNAKQSETSVSGLPVADDGVKASGIADAQNFDRAQLIRIAVDNLQNSYAPYSDCYVSSAVLMGSGKIYTGCNVENASYPAGICAERNAIFHAIGEGESTIVAIAIVGGKDSVITDYCAPCGICRQVMREFCDPKNMMIVMAKTETDYKEMTLDELLPDSFGPDFLE